MFRMSDISEAIAEEQDATTMGGYKKLGMEKVVATTRETLSTKELTLKSTGLLGIALLALTACGGDEDPAPESTEEQNDTSEDAGDGDDTGEDESTEETAADAPTIGELDEGIWDASLNQESVTISAEVPASSMGAASEDATSTEGESIQIVLSGNMDGDGYSYTINETLGDYLIFSDQAFQTVDSVIEEYAQAQVEDQGPSPEELRAEVETEGEWVDITSLAEQLETPSLFIENFRTSMLSSAGVEDLSEWDLEPELDTRDGEDVWVYSEETAESTIQFVVKADEAEPLLMEVHSEAEGQETLVTFSDWNEVEEPERPAEDVVITEEDFMSIAQSLV